MFRIESVLNAHYIEVDLVEQADAAYAPGDALLSVAVKSHGFVGATEVWVLQEEFKEFAVALRKLNDTLRGSARLNSISPKELTLEVVAVSSRGHVAVKGELGYYIREQERGYWHSVAFGFEFEPSQLQRAVQATTLAAGAA